jgi:peptidoglycan/xylan/chitin deacetylase (PgdA/CDA1 family)
MAVQFRRLAKQIVASLIYYSGLFGLIRFLNGLRGSCVAIVTFHRVGGAGCADTGSSLPNLFISEGSFEEVIRFLRRRFNPISFPDLLHAVENQQKIPRHSVVITFDDGYEDNYTHAFPVLKKFRVSATFFLTSSFIDSKKIFWWDAMFHALRQMKPAERYNGEAISGFISGLWDAREEEIAQALRQMENSAGVNTEECLARNRMLSWHQVREMKDSGMTFGSHSRTHVNLNRVAKPRLMEELLASKREIERNLGEEVLFFAYPGGSFSERTNDAVVECGYRCACSTESGVNHIDSNLFGLKRINLWQGAVSGITGRSSKSLIAMHLLRHYRNRSKT